MIWTKYAGGVGVIACLLAPTAAFAADATRSADALPAPTYQQIATAPTSGVRTSTKLERKSNALGGPGAIVAGTLAAGIVIGGIILAVSGDDEPDSAG